MSLLGSHTQVHRWLGVAIIVAAMATFSATAATPALAMFKSPGAASSGGEGTKKLPEAVAHQKALVLALYHPERFDDPVVSDVGIALTRKEATRVEVLGEKPDLSDLGADGVLYVASHGAVRELQNESDEEISLESVWVALNDPKFGIPKDFRGTIHLLACDAGLRPFDKGRLTEAVNQHLIDEFALQRKTAVWITDALSKYGGLSDQLLGTIKGYLTTKLQIPAHRVKGVIDYLTMVNETAAKSNQSVVDLLAERLTKAGRHGITVMGARGRAVTGPHGLELVPKAWMDPSLVAKALTLSNAVTQFYLGKPNSADALLAAGVRVDPSRCGEFRYDVDLRESFRTQSLGSHAALFVNTMRPVCLEAVAVLRGATDDKGEGLYLDEKEAYLRVTSGSRPHAGQ